MEECFEAPPANTSGVTLARPQQPQQLGSGLTRPDYYEARAEMQDLWAVLGLDCEPDDYRSISRLILARIAGVELDLLEAEGALTGLRAFTENQLNRQ